MAHLLRPTREAWNLIGMFTGGRLLGLVLNLETFTLVANSCQDGDIAYQSFCHDIGTDLRKRDFGY